MLAFDFPCYVFKGDIYITLKRKIFGKTLSLTQETAAKLKMTQRSMKRSILVVTLRDKIRTEYLTRQAHCEA